MENELEKIEEEIWQLENSYGRGAFADGTISRRIAELERRAQQIANAALPKRGHEER